MPLTLKALAIVHFPSRHLGPFLVKLCSFRSLFWVFDTVDPVCGICQKQNETVAHALWSCPMATNVWALVAGKLQKRSSEVEDFYGLVRELMDVLSTKELEVWTMVSWSIWNARNRCLFDKKQVQPCETLRRAMTLLQDYQRLCK